MDQPVCFFHSHNGACLAGLIGKHIADELASKQDCAKFRSLSVWRMLAEFGRQLIERIEALSRASYLGGAHINHWFSHRISPGSPAARQVSRWSSRCSRAVLARKASHRSLIVQPPSATSGTEANLGGHVRVPVK